MLVFAAVVCGLCLNLAELKSVDRLVKRAAGSRAPVCYDRVGCFSDGPPFTTPTRKYSLLPENPDKILTKYLLFTRESSEKASILDARYPAQFTAVWPNYKTRPTKIIVHGFLDGFSFDPWMKDMKDELLHQGDYNIIIVDWSGGNNFPYIQGTGNTRLVGAQIADLIKTIQANNSQPPADFHMIGHSLGAHIAGYTGERVPGLGRISGMDPAGPYYSGTDPAVRLDPTDAVFVDVVHTDGTVAELFGVGHAKGMGSRQQMGHADYYVNGGHDQPGCEGSSVSEVFGNTMKNGVVQGFFEYVGCSHFRSIRLFTESINGGCPFVGFPCSSEEDFNGGRCNTCPNGACGKMGFHSNDVIPTTPTRYYLLTSERSPYCEYHIEVSVRLHRESEVERGHLKAMLLGSKGSSAWKTFHDNPIHYRPSSVHNFTFGVPTDIGKVTAVRLSWDHDSSLINPGKWNIFGLRAPKLKVDDVRVWYYESGHKATFCANGTEVETDKVITIEETCPQKIKS